MCDLYLTLKLIAIHGLIEVSIRLHPHRMVEEESALIARIEEGGQHASASAASRIALPFAVPAFEVTVLSPAVRHLRMILAAGPWHHTAPSAMTGSVRRPLREEVPAC